MSREIARTEAAWIVVAKATEAMTPDELRALADRVENDRPRFVALRQEMQGAASELRKWARERQAA